MINSKSPGGSNNLNIRSKFNSNSSQRDFYSSAIPASQLMKLFEDELKDIFWAEKVLTKTIPKMIKSATSRELIEMLLLHLDETNVHVERLAKVFSSLNKKPVARKCEAMEGLINAALEIIEASDVGSICDAGIISAFQKVEHFEIASYSTLRQFADTLGLKDAVNLLSTTLEEEKAIDERISEIACIVIKVNDSEINS
jgi:ferritin-like metal-binding protein YciE